MEHARVASPRSSSLLRTRSRASSLPRRMDSSSPHPTLLFYSSNSAPAALTHTKSTAKNHPQADDTNADSSRLSKENRKSPLSVEPAACLRKPWPVPSAWALSPGRSPSHSASVPAQIDAKGKKKVKTAPPARVRSPVRSTDPPREEHTTATGGKKGGGGGVLSLFRRRKEAAVGEDDSHQLRMLASRLGQWRFANARAEAAVRGSRCNAEQKMFYVWLRIYELRNLVAAKRILMQRRKQKQKLAQIVQTQVRLLSQWEPHAKKHIEAVATLVRLLGAACLALPFVQGAQADLLGVHRCINKSVEIMGDIVAMSGNLYSQAGDVDTLLHELVQTIRAEIRGLEELIDICKTATSLEMHEVSLRAHMIQAMKEEEELIILYPQHGIFTFCKPAVTSLRIASYHTLIGTTY